MNITNENKVGEIATEHPLATRVFARYQIDYCCGGGTPLNLVCQEKGLEVSKIIEEIEKELNSTSETDLFRWDQAKPEELIEHILATYHRPLDEELPRLAGMAEKVNRVHGEKNPQMFSELVKVFVGLKNELEQHMMKEEQILFPMIKSGQGTMAGPPINVMHQEHEDAGKALLRLRELTNNYKVPENACNTWTALWHGLEALETSLHQHIHLENNILFPKALNG